MSLDDLNNLCSEKDTSYVQFCMITMNMMVIHSANGPCSIILIYSIALDYPPIVDNYSHIHVPLGGIVKLIMTAQ